MTLHEAIVQVLKEAGRPMTTQEIADVLNRNKLYQKRDGSDISAFQIHGRTKNYSNLFDRNGSIVSLKSKTGGSQAKNLQNKTVKRGDFVSKKSELPVIKELEEIEKQLINPTNFKSAGKIDKLVPEHPGMYCIRIKTPEALPGFYAKKLKKKKHDIVYIGIASQALNRRMLNQELRANGHGTFFRSLGAVLGFCPPFNSLADKKNKKNYKFSDEDERKIIDWINKNLMVNWVKTFDPKKFEKTLIEKYKPLLNLTHNPAALPELSAARKKCVEVANGREKFK